MTSVPDDTNSAAAKKPVEIEDLPPKGEADERSGDIKGGATVEPCWRPPRRNLTDREIQPCFRPGNSSTV